ncbi:hypothetical protein [Natronoglomus mannanivorans]|uniref:Uncharacterized protein n=1 Tax=Natronoglomus mannanivorans TaxID=2979990 RepID=A0AAP2Z4N3_9EURY|nr:hypothetical protein [Halobacteria archaeon AArc-xg1-1]
MSNIKFTRLFVSELDLTPAESIDYVTVGWEGTPQGDWADSRGVSQQAVSHNISEARKKLSKDSNRAVLRELFEDAISGYADVLVRDSNDGDGYITIRIDDTYDLEESAGLGDFDDINPVPKDRHGDPDYDQFDRNMEMLGEEVKSALVDELDCWGVDVDVRLVDGPIEDDEEDVDYVPSHKMDVEIKL